MKSAPLACFLVLLCARPLFAADLLVRITGDVTEGKVLPSPPAGDLLFQPADPKDAPVQHVARADVKKIITVDDHGAPVGPTPQQAKLWPVPPQPLAPPVLPAPATPAYYLIPLHGEVGQTILACALEKSLADALLRHPTVVVLDIDSPGGLVGEAEQIIKVIHAYNAKLRIVALTDQDLSAAAILSLSVKEIYVKPTSTIGAATAFQMSNANLPADIQEKMQSAWRAVARNSAEEGGHNPLLADAMIDSSLELHVETGAAGAPVIKEGPGDRTLVHQGKILTLTSHEAVDCGLAVAIVENMDDLGVHLKMPGWKPIAGLGTLLAADLPKRNAAYHDQIEKVGQQVHEDILGAESHDPSVGTLTRTTFAQPLMPARPVVPQPPVRIVPGGRIGRGMPGRPTVPGVPVRPAPMPGVPVREVITSDIRAKWKSRSLACVVALQAVESDLRDAISLSDAFGEQGEAASIQKLLEAVSSARATVFDERNKYPPRGSSVAAAPPAPAATRPATPAAHSTAATPAPTPAGARVPFIRIGTVADAERALASSDAHNNTNAARFLTSAPVDPASQAEVLKALQPFLDDTTAQKAPYIGAFAHWARQQDMPVLLASLKRPITPPNDVGDAQCWGNAFLAILHYAPDEAEKAINDHKANFFFKQNILHLLQRLIADDSVYAPTAEKLLPLLQK
ncbi:MAG TPA: hypothetical protein VH253_08170 [Phycisphaerae bacterium]|nr:hypothetical protein [Phycisphaerae bacterium]